MKFKSLAATALAGMMLVGALAGCGSSTKDTATNNGKEFAGEKLAMYVSCHENTAKALAQKFEEKTGAEVNFIRLPTGEAIARMIVEVKNPKADVWMGGTSDAHVLLKNKKVLESYASVNDKLIPEAYRGKDDVWHGLYLETLAIGYNVDRFEKEFKAKGVKAPTSLEDLLQPELKGEIIAPDPSKSGTAYTFLSSIVQLKGEQDAFDYLKKFKGQVAQFTSSGFTPAQKCATGEYLVTVNFVADQMLASRNAQKISSTIYKNAGWSVVPISKVNKKENSAVAEAFIDFCLTKEAGEIITKTTNAIACNPEVAPPAGSKPLKELELFTGYDFVKAGVMKKELTKKFAEL